jgi:hypothetical protein
MLILIILFFALLISIWTLCKNITIVIHNEISNFDMGVSVILDIATCFFWTYFYYLTH